MMRTDPIIITGAGHSGTRGLVQVLTQAGNVYLGNIDNNKREWEFYRFLARKVNGRLLSLPEQHNFHIIPPEIYARLHITAAECNEMKAFMLQEIQAQPRQSLPPEGADIWVIKTPRTTLCLEIWHAVFPGARFIHLVRDGRDVAASLPENAGSLLHRFNLWRARVNRIHWYQRQGMPIIDFRYEDLPVAAKLQGLCSSLGIVYSPQMREQIVMSVGKGQRQMRGLPYERMELHRYDYPIQERGRQQKIMGRMTRLTNKILSSSQRAKQKLNRILKREMSELT